MMICRQGKVSLQSFFGSFLLFSFICTNYWYHQITHIGIHCLSILLFLINIYVNFKVIWPDEHQIAIRAGFLGFIFSLGIYLKLVALPNIQIFGVYMSILAFFHFSEFFIISIIQPKHVSTDSFVINHSLQYTVAAVLSWTEFFVETLYFPNLKEFYWISNIGLLLCIAGETLRKVAMLTAGSNFNHLIKSEKVNEHILVTHGVYSWFRHPSYVGWFYWSIGTQVVLINPFCTLAYTVASWMFFKDRIFIEEITLLNFFGQQYCDYQQKVGIGIPFIKGYKI